MKNESTANLNAKMLDLITRQGIIKREVILLAIIGIVFAVMPFLNPGFLRFSNIRVLLIGSVNTAIMALGVGLLLVMGELDLSVGANLALSGTLAALGMKQFGMPVPIAVIYALAASTVVGVINGLLVVKVGINFLITTLATLGIVRGIVILLAEGGVAFLPDSFNVLGQMKILNLQLPVWIMFGLVILLGILLAKHRYFRQLYYIGGSMGASRLVGIRTDRVRLTFYVLSGLLAGIAGILSTARFGSAFPTAGQGAELQVVSAVVLGGCSLQGGKGNIMGIFLGVMFMGILSNVLVMLNVSTYWHQIINGIVLISAIAFDNLMQKVREEQKRKQSLA